MLSFSFPPSLQRAKKAGARLLVTLNSVDGGDSTLQNTMEFIDSILEVGGLVWWKEGEGREGRGGEGRGGDGRGEESKYN